MATFGIDGLASGLNTTALINQLMEIEAVPQARLKTKQTATQSIVTALQALNTRTASLATAAEKAASAESWSAWKATSSASTVTAAASSNAHEGSISFSVDRLAKAQVSVSAAVPDDGALAGDPPAVTIRTGDGSLVTVHPASGSLTDIARAISEDASTGVRASVVRVTGGDEPTYRLQFTGVATGEESGFAVFAGTDDSGTRLDTAQVQAAQDAQITLWKGIDGLEQPITSSMNVFSELSHGLAITVSKVTAEDDPPVTVTVGRDTAALTKLASDMMSNVGVVLSEIASRTATRTETNTDGSTSVTGGLLSGDSGVRFLSQNILAAVSSPVDGTSPAEVGIIIGRDGTFTFDQEVFATALAEDPAKVQSMITQIAERVAAVATNASDSETGSITLKIQGQESLVKDLGTQIESWDRRLETRRATLDRTYAALEVTLSGLQSQSSWLASQLAALPSYSTSNS